MEEQKIADLKVTGSNPVWAFSIWLLGDIRKYLLLAQWRNGSAVDSRSKGYRFKSDLGYMKSDLTQRKRTALITQKSLDRNQQSLFHII